eukprot:4271445-Prymnesium_polylepis.2
MTEPPACVGCGKNPRGACAAVQYNCERHVWTRRVRDEPPAHRVLWLLPPDTISETVVSFTLASHLRLGLADSRYMRLGRLRAPTAGAGVIYRKHVSSVLSRKVDFKPP